MDLISPQQRETSECRSTSRKCGARSNNATKDFFHRYLVNQIRRFLIRPLHPKQTSLCRVRCECVSGRGERVHKVSPHHRTRSRPVTLSPHRSPRAGRMIEDDAYYCPISPPRRATATAAAAAVNVWPRSISRGHGAGGCRSFSS